MLFRSTQTQTQTQAKSSPARAQKKPAADSDSETEPEDEEEEELLLDSAAAASRKPAGRAGAPLPTPEPDDDAMEIDPARAPGRIVGAAFPLKDFRANIARGDLVTKAVEDLAFVVKDVVAQPFAKLRTDEMLECMRELRKVALEVRVYCVVCHNLI